jgi:hypothetical protein
VLIVLLAHHDIKSRTLAAKSIPDTSLRVTK